VAAAVAMVLGGVPRGARLALFAPFFAAAIYLLQARDHTCVMLAARNQCEIGQGVGAVGDAWLARQLRRQALEVLVEATAVAAFVTGLVLLIPG
jgi:predicted kinase